MGSIVPHSVIIHVVSQCHEEGLEHYLRSFLKVNIFLIVSLLNASHLMLLCFFVSYYSGY